MKPESLIKKYDKSTGNFADNLREMDADDISKQFDMTLADARRVFNHIHKQAPKAAPISQLLRELNELRKAAGDSELKQWKASRATLLAALEKANERAMKVMDPLDIPAFLDRKDPRSYINQAITPEIQKRIDDAMLKAKTAVVGFGSSFAKIDDMRAEEKKARLAKATRPAKEKKAPPPANSFHLTSLCDVLNLDARGLRQFARGHVDFLKPLELQKYIYRESDRTRIVAYIQKGE